MSIANIGGKLYDLSDSEFSELCSIYNQLEAECDAHNINEYQKLFDRYKELFEQIRESNFDLKVWSPLYQAPFDDPTTLHLRLSKETDGTTKEIDKKPDEYDWDKIKKAWSIGGQEKNRDEFGKRKRIKKE